MTETYTIRTAPEWQGVRIARLETPPAPAATPRTPRAQPSRRERLRRGYELIVHPAMRSAFRRRFWKELSS